MKQSIEKKEGLSSKQEKWCQFLADGMSEFDAYMKVVGKKKVSSSSARGTIAKWKQKEAITSKLEALLRLNQSERTLKRIAKREIISTMVNRLTTAFHIVYGQKDYERAAALGTKITKLIETDNQMSGDNAPEKIDQNLTLNIMKYGENKNENSNSSLLGS